MSLSAMTFHESYGHLPKSTLRLIRKYNVSPADLDFILDQLMYKDEVRWDGSAIPADWSDVEQHIISNSKTGMYQPRFF